MDYELFLAEDQVVRDVLLALENGDLSLEESRGLLNWLLTDYRKLLRETKQLVKLSDRREKELNALNAQLKDMAQALDYQANHDLLTKVLNRAGISKIIEAALQAGEDFVLIVFDVDYFKRVNDSFGHLAGDAVLSGLGSLIQACLPDGSHLGRLGGEEFLILLPDVAIQEGARIAEQVRQAVESAQFDYRDMRLSVTISLGLTHCRNDDTMASVYGRADRALYMAKQAGRNRTECC